MYENVHVFAFGSLYVEPYFLHVGGANVYQKDLRICDTRIGQQPFEKGLVGYLCSGNAQKRTLEILASDFGPKTLFGLSESSLKSLCHGRDTRF